MNPMGPGYDDKLDSLRSRLRRQRPMYRLGPAFADELREACRWVTRGCYLGIGAVVAIGLVLALVQA